MAKTMKIVSLDILKYYDAKSKTRMEEADAQVLVDAKGYADSLADNYDPAGTSQTKVDELANGAVKANTEAIEAINNAETGILKQAKDYTDAEAKKVQDEVDALEKEVGTLDDLETTAKEDLVKAINEVRNAVSVGGTAAAISMDTTTTTEGYLKSYTIKQGTNVIGTIDIPKDLVVESGSVVTNPEGQAEGTYIKLVLANVSEPLYINVGTLVDIYTTQSNATQIQLAIDSSTREISATVVAESITTTELAPNAVTTVKIADANVTKAKLSTEVQSSLDKADAAATDATTKANKALEDAKAYTDGLATNYATASQGALADSAVQEIATGTENGTVSVDGADVAVKGLGSAAYTSADAYEVAGAANTALTDSKAYTDAEIEKIDLSGIATNASDIDKLEASLAEGGATYVSIATAQATATQAQSEVDAVEGRMDAAESEIDALQEAFNAIEDVTTEEIDQMFIVA